MARAYINQGAIDEIKCPRCGSRPGINCHGMGLHKKLMLQAHIERRNAYRDKHGIPRHYRDVKDKPLDMAKPCVPYVEDRLDYWNRVGHKNDCPTYGDEEMIERCTCDDPEPFQINWDTTGALLFSNFSKATGGVTYATLHSEAPTYNTREISGGYTTASGLWNPHNKKESIVNKRQRLAALKAEEEIALARKREMAELEAELAARPSEPEVDAVVSFEREYERGGKKYSFVAYQAVAGKWYLSQDPIAQANRGRGRGIASMTWDELLDFIDDNTIYIVTKWEVLS